MSEPGFTVDVYQNEYLPEGGRELHAVITVMSAELAGPAEDVGGAEIIMIDCSRSMAWRPRWPRRSGPGSKPALRPRMAAR